MPGSASADEAWEQWFNVHYGLWEELEQNIDKVTTSPEFGAALVAALIEHLAEKLRFYITLPAPDVGNQLETSSEDGN